MTADEIWAQLPGTREASVHLADFPRSPASWIDAERDARWATLARVRRSVNEKLEIARGLKDIGAPLTAHVTLSAGSDLYDLLKGDGIDLPMVCIVSEVTLQRAPEGQAADLDVTVARASGDKCPRCWRFVPALEPAGNEDAVCPRCAEAVLVA